MMVASAELEGKEELSFSPFFLFPFCICFPWNFFFLPFFFVVVSFNLQHDEKLVGMLLAGFGIRIYSFPLVHCLCVQSFKNPC